MSGVAQASWKGEQASIRKMPKVMVKCCRMHKVGIQMSEFNHPEILKITL